ncbi:unnamed protein product [Nezara viridula]|uniref:SWIM-type domain-containing protein n=1 Tax=Nezara viridula TaxID=85310 RepID=A0A9P0MTE2_NEZVI|nr:unnamed protein product [Nezara viridula]
MQNEDRLRAMLKDLGRSTLRGIRKCYKCGTLNGTRGLSCKNKACDVVFTEAGRRKKQSMEVCKLNTGTSTRVFSVRVRDKGPDFRGFVQLPVVQPNLDETESAYLNSLSALCFVESCQRLFNTSLLKCHESGMVQPTTTCQHIQSAMRCCSDAVVLHIDYKALETINTSKYIKDTIWQLNTDTPGALVQRVSKAIMAVKCKVTTKHPLGFLHVTFFLSTRLKEKDSYFTCTCATYKNHAKSLDNSKNCIHYYACVAAFASDAKLTTEFSTFVSRERIAEIYTVEIDANEEECRLVEILNNTINQSEVEIEVLDKDSSFILPEFPETDLDGLTSIVDVSNDLGTGLDSQNFSSVMNQDITGKIKIKPKPRKKKISSNTLEKKRGGNKDFMKQFHFAEVSPDPNSVTLPFINWLASVTERMNQLMHFQLDGKPEPLVFHIPHLFFDCLLDRFMTQSIEGNKRKRLPNLVTTFDRKTTPPFGTFYNYTWHITNLSHAKAIFDTPLLSLNLSRSFVQTGEGTYEELDPASIEEGLVRREGQRPIRPIELKTYLKIGVDSPDQESPSILSINWTPNVLPISKIGELKITFEYGHIHGHL